jgi:CheY-like chemotaxis protein
MEHLLSRGLDILTVHRRRITGLTIKTDLQKIGVTVAGYDQASTLAEAQAYLRARPPHVVILDLCLPNGDAYRLLDAYQPSRREFAVILMDEEQTNGPSHGERHRGVEALVEHQAAGYLVYPQFHNLNLARSVEQARGKLQSRLLTEYQHDIIEQLLRSTLGHPALPAPPPHSAPPMTGKAPFAHSDEDTSRLLLHHAQAAQTLAIASSSASGVGKKAGIGKKASGVHHHHVRYADIIRLEKQDHYVWLHWFGADGAVAKALVRTETIPLLDGELPVGFHQVHRSHVVNLLHIVEVGSRRLLMRCGSDVPLAAREQQRMQEVIEQFSRQVGVLGDLQRLLQQNKGKHKGKRGEN